MSDQLTAYTTLNAVGFKHLTSNHSENFVHPFTDANIQIIKSFWSHSNVFKKDACLDTGITLSTSG